MAKAGREGTHMIKRRLFVSLGLQTKIPADWVAYRTRVCFLTVVEAGKSQINGWQHPVPVSPLFLVYRWLPSCFVLMQPFLGEYVWRGGEESLLCLLQ